MARIPGISINPKIADVFFKSSLMEAWGRGIANIFDECEKYGLPTPEFKVGHKIVTLVIRFKNSITPHRKDDGPVNGPILILRLNLSLSFIFP